MFSKDLHLIVRSVDRNDLTLPDKKSHQPAALKNGRLVTKHPFKIERSVKKHLIVKISHVGNRWLVERLIRNADSVKQSIQIRILSFSISPLDIILKKKKKNTIPISHIFASTHHISALCSEDVPDRTVSTNSFQQTLLLHDRDRLPEIVMRHVHVLIKVGWDFFSIEKDIHNSGVSTRVFILTEIDIKLRLVCILDIILHGVTPFFYMYIATQPMVDLNPCLKKLKQKL